MDTRLKYQGIIKTVLQNHAMIILAYGILKCLLGKTFRTILRKKLSV